MMQKRIMVIDDDRETAESISEFLVSKGWDVSLFYSSKEVFANQDNRADVIIVDFELPDIDGTLLLQELLGENPDATGIIISANPAWEIRQKALEIGAKYFFPKPINLNLLAERIK